MKVAHSGYTGEQFGAVHVTEIDVMAYTLATEKGFVLMTDICDCNPFEVEMDKTRVQTAG